MSEQYPVLVQFPNLKPLTGIMGSKTMAQAVGISEEEEEGFLSEIAAMLTSLTAELIVGDLNYGDAVLSRIESGELSLAKVIFLAMIGAKCQLNNAIDKRLKALGFKEEED